MFFFLCVSAVPLAKVEIFCYLAGVCRSSDCASGKPPRIHLLGVRRAPIMHTRGSPILCLRMHAQAHSETPRPKMVHVWRRSQRDFV
ncbi:uncharacterized protein CANTADRAFT_334000 [Suhomyces tanzawaensis NRRL Y-17324]|uniref:Secreted protein n=1 Tax=Suhomyces tanzawaensis NRRL Y-17324 TaxID=984487 RepID=A0A1E4SBB2_9ASCO|nr:uncharacterized protein CANTADRAFT_334000 [Suhomyces tanzawaensis NRRL Y-17324]ODV76817.1 hypothetical protein CANTADRAFT_334000 [Suhomyces tanzawaensis NRRL Y-17324]